MIEIKVNGELQSVSQTTLAEYLASANFDSFRIAVERNGEIVPKASYQTVTLEDGDSLEIVRFVGGG